MKQTWIVDWEAISAVAAAGVLVWAVWEHGQSARQRRSRDIALLRALIVVTRGAEKSFGADGRRRWNKAFLPHKWPKRSFSLAVLKSPCGR